MQSSAVAVIADLRMILRKLRLLFALILVRLHGQSARNDEVSHPLILVNT